MMKLLKTAKAASAIEYGILVGLIAVAGISVVFNLGTTNKDTFDGVTATLADRVLGRGGSGEEVAGNGGSGASIVLPANVTAEDCYDPANVNTVGQAGWTGCEGMLIVDTAMLKGAGSSFNQNIGDNSFAIAGPDGEIYTFEESGFNIFTGQVTDMSRLIGATSFNGDIGYWDTSSVTNMNYMFNNASAFNQDISGWDTSSVTSMREMFYGASSFNQPLDSWDVSSVTDMVRMFNYAAAFNQSLDSWDVSGVTQLAGMFNSATSFNQPLDSWDVSGVTNMNSMFSSASSFNQPLDSWDVSGVTSMNNMFNNASAFNQDLLTWCVSNITTAPTGFDTDAASWTEPKPVWGTCPTP